MRPGLLSQSVSVSCLLVGRNLQTEVIQSQTRLMYHHWLEEKQKGSTAPASEASSDGSINGSFQGSF